MPDQRPDTARSDYILGGSDEELRRLAEQHETWKASADELWDRCNFGEGQTILDLGCGPGYTTVDLAERVGPKGRVIAVDSAPKFIAHLRKQIEARGLSNIDVHERDVHDLELGEHSIDGAYARWVLCFLREPEKVIADISRALRPGGRFASTDYFNYRAFTLAPRSPAMDRVVEAVQRSWKLKGGDLEIQGRTARLMAGAGLEIGGIQPIAGIARHGDPLWNWPQSFFRNFLPTLIEMELITPAEGDAFLRDWEDRAADPAAFLCLPPMLDVVGVQPRTPAR